MDMMQKNNKRAIETVTRDGAKGMKVFSFPWPSC
jgi:hypothetical protein